MLEIRSGEGGQDSKNFTHELAGIYLKYAQRLGFEKDLLDTTDGTSTLWFKGKNVHQAFQNEGGKHVIQRVPITESNGRRQTSVVTVAVLKLLPNPPKLNPQDIAQDVDWNAQRSHGKGGQNQNKVSSAVRMVHKPTGIQVLISGRDQKQNYRRALQILTSKVEEIRQQKIHKDYNDQRTSQYRGAGRGDKIRTYNLIRQEVTDHRTDRSVPSWEIWKGKLEGLWN